MKKALKNDTKVGIVSEKLPSIISQLTVWDKNKILDNKELIFNTLNKFGDEWELNLICLEEGKSYIISPNYLMLQSIQKLLNGKIKEYCLECEEVWLRKEIIKQAEK